MGMKVFNLACEFEHRFEGWFGSAADYDEQFANGLLSCPVCGSRSVRKLLSAPRLNLGAVEQAPETSDRHSAATGRDTAPIPVAAPSVAQMQALLAKLARHLVETTEDVGERFAEEARRIHYDEAPARGIRGIATRAQAEALEDEGIEFLSLPGALIRKENLQ